MESAGLVTTTLVAKGAVLPVAIRHTSRSTAASRLPLSQTAENLSQFAGASMLSPSLFGLSTIRDQLHLDMIAIATAVAC
jgi:hypothetical protein